jgi:Peptidase family M41
MNDERADGQALTIPALSIASGDLIKVTIRSAARDHLLGWDAAQRLSAIHESGHACAAAHLGIGVASIDITSRIGGHVEITSPLDDTSIPWETSGRMLDNIVVALAGSAAERVMLGEHTSGGETDNDRAVATAMRWCKAGFAGPEVIHRRRWPRVRLPQRRVQDPHP